MKIEEELVKLLKSKGLKHDSIEFSVKLKNSKNHDENIQIIGSSTIEQLSTMTSYVEIFSKLHKNLIEELFKSIDEMEYLRLFHPSHYEWINSEDYKEWKSKQNP